MDIFSRPYEFPEVFQFWHARRQQLFIFRDITDAAIYMLAEKTAAVQSLHSVEIKCECGHSKTMLAHYRAIFEEYLPADVVIDFQTDIPTSEFDKSMDAAKDQSLLKWSLLN